MHKLDLAGYSTKPRSLHRRMGVQGLCGNPRVCNLVPVVLHRLRLQLLTAHLTATAVISIANIAATTACSGCTRRYHKRAGHRRRKRPSPALGNVRTERSHCLPLPDGRTTRHYPRRSWRYQDPGDTQCSRCCSRKPENATAIQREAADAANRDAVADTRLAYAWQRCYCGGPRRAATREFDSPIRGRRQPARAHLASHAHETTAQEMSAGRRRPRGRGSRHRRSVWTAPAGLDTCSSPRHQDRERRQHPRRTQCMPACRTSRKVRPDSNPGRG